MRKSVWIFVFVLMSMPSLSRGEQPTDVLKKSIEEGIRILKDPQYQHASQKEKQKERLRQVSQNIFDFVLFSRLVLASNWKNFTQQQQREFSVVFAKFVSEFYLSKLQEKYKEEKVIYVGEDLMAGSRARVRVKVLWKGQEVPVEVWMVRRHGTWKVCDISALGVSAVRIYRAQFRAILLKDSPAQVIERIKERIRQPFLPP